MNSYVPFSLVKDNDIQEVRKIKLSLGVKEVLCSRKYIGFKVQIERDQFETRMESGQLYSRNQLDVNWGTQEAIVDRRGVSVFLGNG